MVHRYHTKSHFISNDCECPLDELFVHQALGAIKVDVKSIGCDFYVTNGHKYCLAPTGTGALYVSFETLNRNLLKTSFVR